MARNHLKVSRRNGSPASSSVARSPEKKMFKQDLVSLICFLALCAAPIALAAPQCSNEKSGTCAEENTTLSPNWMMPLTKLGDRKYYLGTFFKANWYKAAKFCRYHGMHLASIETQEENDRLEKHIKDFGFGLEHFWVSGTDQGDEGNFFWTSTGRPVTFTNWNAGEPNNFRYENGEEEHCLELWNRDGKGMKWNDSPCSFETYFICEYYDF